MTITLLLFNMKLSLFIFDHYGLLISVINIGFTVSYSDVLDRLRVHLNIILLSTVTNLVYTLCTLSTDIVNPTTAI